MQMIIHHIFGNHPDLKKMEQSPSAFLHQNVKNDVSEQI